MPGPTGGSASRRFVLARYVVAAALVRTTDGGAAVGLVALAVEVRRDAGDGAAVGSLLAALIAPAVLGPWVARPLDRVRDPRVPLAASFVLFGGGLAASAMLLGRAPLAVAAVPIAAAGGCVPLLTGGLSSRLVGLVGGHGRALRRAEGWDATTYGLAVTVGPGVVAVLLGSAGAANALVVLGAAASVAAALVMTLPPAAGTGGERGWSVRRTARVLLGAGPLRRVLVATALTELGTSGIAVVAVVTGTRSGSTATGAAVAAVYGAGNLLGSLAVTVLPMRGEPERLTLRCVAVVGLAVGLCAPASGLPATIAAFALAGAAQAVLITASFAVRSSYAPPPARAQVFATMAGLKMAAGAAGLALTGQLLRYGPRPVLAVGAALALAAVAVALLDRRGRARGASAAGC